MEKTEILALIDKAIKGQGTNVDAGGALATILEGILETISPYDLGDWDGTNDLPLTDEEGFKLYDCAFVKGSHGNVDGTFARLDSAIKYCYLAEGEETYLAFCTASYSEGGEPSYYGVALVFTGEEHVLRYFES